MHSEGRVSIFCKDYDIRKCFLQKKFENYPYCGNSLFNNLKISFDDDYSSKKNLEEGRKTIKKENSENIRESKI